MSEYGRDDKPRHEHTDDARHAHTEDSPPARLSETEFDLLLGRELTEPPDYITSRVKPWKHAFGLLSVGLALSTVVLNNGFFEYLLPAVGQLLILLGSRRLKRVNHWFGAIYAVAIFRAADNLLSLALNATVTPEVLPSAIFRVLTALNVLSLLFGLFCLWRGILVVQRGAGREARAGWAIILLLWYSLIVILVLCQVTSISVLFGFILLVGYIFSLYSLYKLSRRLDEVGYTITVAPSRLSDRALTLLYILAITASIVVAGIFGGGYPVKLIERSRTESHNIDIGADISSDIDNIKSNLTALGFPEYVLCDLSIDELLSLSGAKVVAYKINDFSSDGECVKRYEYTSDARYAYYGSFFNNADLTDDIEYLRIADIGVRRSDDSYVIIHHFKWGALDDTGADLIRLSPDSRNYEFVKSDSLSGRMLCEIDGVTYVSDYYYLGNFDGLADLHGNESYSTGIMQIARASLGSQNRDICAHFSLPDGDSPRGYILYETAAPPDGSMLSSWIYYTHRQNRLHYPALDGYEAYCRYGLLPKGGFCTFDGALQFYHFENPRNY